MKRILSFLMAFLLLQWISADAQKVKVGDLYYNLDSSNLTAEVTYSISSQPDIYNPAYPDLTSLSIPETIKYGSKTYKVTSIGSHAFYGLKITGSLTIPESVTSIGDRAFENCSGFTGSLTIPESVTSIGNYAFDSCSGFTGSLTIGNSVKTIGQAAFSGCSGFDGTLTLGNSVKTIGGAAFQNCSGFTGSLIIPESVTEIGSMVFYGCSGFTQVDITNLEVWCNINFEATYSNPLWYAHHLYLNGKEITNLEIPPTLTEIKDYIFCGGSSFTGPLNIPESVTKIGNGAFDSCSGFTGSLTIPESVTKIGNDAFYGCSGFTGSLTIPESVTKIGDYAFSGCSRFNGSITIPESVTSIGSYAFENCSGFTGSLTIPESVTSIGKYAFYGCSGFTGSLTIPESVTEIGNQVFYGCSGFDGSLSLPKSLTSIGDYAFYRCSGFTGSLIIPESVTEIGFRSFTGCSGFEPIMYSLTPTPPATYSESLPPTITTVYVPVDSRGAYEQASIWKNFTIREIPGKLEGSLEVEDFAINAGETMEADVNFVGELNANTYSGFQFNLSMPEGLTVTGAKLGEGLTSAGFTLRTSTTGTDKILVISVNTSGKSAEITDGLVTLTIAAAPNAPHGVSQISLTGASFSSPLGEDLLLSDSETTVTINNIPVNAFTFEPEGARNIYVGQNCTVSASPLPENATNKNFTWSITDEEGVLEKVSDENGVIAVKGLKLGSATLTATADDFEGYSASVTVNVVPTPAESVEISDEDLLLLEGTTWQLTATVLPEETTYKTVTWSSESDDIATVTQEGLVTAVKEGQTTIKATCGEVSGTCTVIVKALGDITVKPGDGSTEGDDDQNPGENTEDGMSVVGSDLILRVGQEGTVTLDINPGLDYDPALVWELAAEGDQYVKMTVGTDDTTTATFEGLAVGETTYTVSTPADNAEVLSGKITVIATNPVMSLTLEPTELTLAENALSYRLTATFSPETVTTPTLNWTSSGESIATVDQQGNVTPVAQGTCDITVATTDGTGLAAVCHVTITKPVDKNFGFDFDQDVMGDAEGIEIYLGATYQFVPKAQDGYELPDNITWSSSDSQTVSVDDDGTIHGLQLGDATITATATFNNEQVTATCDVTVIPIPAKTITINGGGVESIKCKETLTLTAKVLPEDTTYPEVTWETSSADNATVSQEGVVTGVKAGSVTITAYVTQYPDVRDTYKLEITDILLGDSNDNGIVTVADVVTTANHLIQLPVIAWSFVNADVTQDNTISMADVTGTVDIILNDFETGYAARRSGRFHAPQLLEDRLVSDNYHGGLPETRIDVKLENSVAYTALQATVILPEGMSVSEVRAGARLSDHILLVNDSQEGVVKVVIFSLYNTAFEDSDEALFSLMADTGNAYGNIRITDIFGSDAQTNEYELGFTGGLNESVVTGVVLPEGDGIVIRTVAEGVEVWNAEGAEVSVYSYNGETVALFPQASAYEKVSLCPGMYIVRAGDTTAKVIVK